MGDSVIPQQKNEGNLLMELILLTGGKWLAPFGGIDRGGSLGERATDSRSNHLKKHFRRFFLARHYLLEFFLL